MIKEGHHPTASSNIQQLPATSNSIQHQPTPSNSIQHQPTASSNVQHQPTASNSDIQFWQYPLSCMCAHTITTEPPKDDFDCRTREVWSEEKKAWCCEKKKLGCGVWLHHAPLYAGVCFAPCLAEQRVVAVRSGITNCTWTAQPSTGILHPASNTHPPNDIQRHATQ